LRSEFLHKTKQDRIKIETSNKLTNQLILELRTINPFLLYQISKTLEKKESDKIWFTPDQREGLNKLIDLIETAFGIMNTNLNMNYKNVTMEDAIAIENNINKTRNKLRKKHLKTVGSEETNLDASLIYSTLFSSLERIGDHIINVTEAMTGEELE